MKSQRSWWAPADLRCWSGCAPQSSSSAGTWGRTKKVQTVTTGNMKIPTWGEKHTQSLFHCTPRWSSPSPGEQRPRRTDRRSDGAQRAGSLWSESLCSKRTRNVKARTSQIVGHISPEVFHWNIICQCWKTIGHSDSDVLFWIHYLLIV